MKILNVLFVAAVIVAAILLKLQHDTLVKLEEELKHMQRLERIDEHNFYITAHKRNMLYAIKIRDSSAIVYYQKEIALHKNQIEMIVDSIIAHR
jgi:hypothetical protein